MTSVAIVGAGIMGLAHAWQAARAGLAVTVFERNPVAQGASIRNFGMLAVVAQADGQQLDDALYSLANWQEIAAHTGLEVQQTGCVFVAREPEEMEVLHDYAASKASTEASATLLSAKQLEQYSAGFRVKNLLGGLWSPDAWKVDQRRATGKIAEWLRLKHGVTFHYSTEVTDVAAPHIETSRGAFKSDHVLLCGGSEFSTLYPDEFAATGITQCQLQMLRTCPQPNGWQLKPFVLGGLSLTRYSAFSDCASLPNLVEMQQTQYSEHLSHGIHVVAAQESDGSITIGDSHRYGGEQPVQRCAEIDRLILQDLRGMIECPELEIAERWLGHYAYLPGTDVLRMSPASNITAITMVNGQGMTHSFAVAKQVIDELT